MKDFCIEDINKLIYLKSDISPPKIELFESIDSTSKYLKDNAIYDNGVFQVVIAKHQTSGYGRFMKRWDSEANGGLWMSIASSIKKINNPSTITLAIGAVIAETLKDIGFKGIGIKWPNDLIYRMKKLGGILVESHAKDEDLTGIIIGVGINFTTPSLSLDTTRYNLQPTSLEKISSDSFDKSQLIASLIISIMYAIKEYDEYGFNPFYETYKKYDFLKGRNITVERNNDNLSGLNDGVYEDGSLVIVNEVGRHRIINGSIIHIEK
tara:strand:+ start:48 stop:845 length:798 start_codon:yes stop_codon:yes gene_type:complete